MRNPKIKALKSQNLPTFAIVKTSLSETKTDERYSVLISTLTNFSGSSEPEAL